MEKLNKHAKLGFRPSLEKVREVQKNRASLISADATRTYQSNTKRESKAAARDSLQSRLLERINIKKQAPQQQIYLEEEISSDEEEDTILSADEADDERESRQSSQNKKLFNF